MWPPTFAAIKRPSETRGRGGVDHDVSAQRARVRRRVVDARDSERDRSSSGSSRCSRRYRYRSRRSAGSSRCWWLRRCGSDCSPPGCIKGRRHETRAGWPCQASAALAPRERDHDRERREHPPAPRRPLTRGPDREHLHLVSSRSRTISHQPARSEQVRPCSVNRLSERLGAVSEV